MTILSPTKESFETAVKTLQNGGIVAFATETVYGLGCDTFNKKAIDLVYKTKGRPIQNPMISHIADVSWVCQLASGWDNRCNKLAEMFWPGPLTIVLQKKEAVPKSACGGRNTIAIRCPSHPVARQLLKRFNKPISAPSANKSGYISPTTAQHVEDEFGKSITILDGGKSEEGIESTVVSLVGNPTILRPGSITQEIIEKSIGPVSKHHQTTQSNSPGTSSQHYSPHTKTKLLSTAEIQKINDTTCITIVIDGNPQQSQKNIQMPVSPKEYGAKIYGVLREADQNNASVICVEQPPKTSSWDAIQDRLLRCTAT